MVGPASCYARKMLPTMKEAQAYCYDNAVEVFRLHAPHHES